MRFLELKIPPVVILLGMAAGMFVIARISPGLSFALPGGRPVAAGVAAIGAMVAILGVISFRRAGTTVNPLHPAAASQLVVSGIYRRTRNPMYLGMLLVLVGWGLFLAHAVALAAAAFVPVMNRLQIIPEERILAGVFGAGFTDYRTKVRRWL